MLVTGLCKQRSRMRPRFWILLLSIVGMLLSVGLVSSAAATNHIYCHSAVNPYSFCTAHADGVFYRNVVTDEFRSDPVCEDVFFASQYKVSDRCGSYGYVDSANDLLPYCPNGVCTVYQAYSYNRFGVVRTQLSYVVY
jgi:hypothetical protein